MPENAQTVAILIVRFPNHNETAIAERRDLSVVLIKSRLRIDLELIAYRSAVAADDAPEDTSAVAIQAFTVLPNHGHVAARQAGYFGVFLVAIK